MIRSYLRGLVSDSNAQDSLALSEQLYVLFEGAISASQLYGASWPVDHAKQAAQRLLEASNNSFLRPRKRPSKQ
jgi:hypothetical protein